MNKEWGAPIHVPMAIMYQESSFRHNAAPPRLIYCLALFPGNGSATPTVYAQAKTGTPWDDYIR